jgi:hypothetical protein
VDPLNTPLPIDVTELGRLIDVIEALLSAPEAISVTPEGTTTVPVHPELLVTILLVIVNVPLVPQFTGPSATATALGMETKPLAIIPIASNDLTHFCIQTQIPVEKLSD